MFAEFIPSDEDLARACAVAVKESLKAKAGETALIITNDETEVFTIAATLFDAFKKEGVKVSLIIQGKKTSLDFAEDAVLAAQKSDPDIIVSLSSEKMGKDREAIVNPYLVDGKKLNERFSYLMATKKSRSFWSPGITREIFIKGANVDYKRMAHECAAVKSVLDLADEVRVVTPAGTDVTVPIRGRTAFADNGIFDKPGLGGNLPGGETYISPANRSCHGTIVFDGSLSLKEGTILANAPVTLVIRDGFIVMIEGKEEADRLTETIKAGEDLAYAWEKEGKLPSGQGRVYAQNAKHIGELGIGLNPAAYIIGNMLMDEKAYHTCHFAIGANYDDDAPALIHQDCLCKEPTITATLPGGETTPILIAGKLDPNLVKRYYTGDFA